MEKCLNCGSIVNDKYCSSCGQKTDTNRFSLKNLLTVEFIRSLSNPEHYKALYTVMQLLIRPGHSSREYIQGKRKKYVNCFLLLGIMTSFMIFLAENSLVNIVDIYSDPNEPSLNDFYANMMQNIRLYNFAGIPIMALLSFWWFKKSKYNYAEHIILNSYLTSGLAIFSIFFYIVTYIDQNIDSLKDLNDMISIVQLGYIIWFYIQHFSVFGYKKGRLFFRTVFAVSTMMIVLCIGLLYLMFIIMAINGEGF
jgi:hypothetical protein